MARPRPRFVRNVNAGPALDTFLVFSIGSVLVTRGYLAATGYPQVGNGTLHVAHVLWGGLLMLIAIIVALATIDIAADRIIAAVGGIGFGLFIDEVGKFITKDVDYFFKPAIAIIYVCFVALFFAFRYLDRSSRLTPEVALANALAVLAEAPIRPLSDDERGRVAYLLSRAPDLAMTAEARAMLTTVTTKSTRRTWVSATYARMVLGPCRRFARTRAFIWLIAIDAVFSVLTVLALAANVFLLIPDSTRRSAQRALEAGAGTSATAICIVIGSVIYGVMMGIGLVRLRRSRLRALVWFDRAYLFSILVVQVFLFAESQFAALTGLVVDLFIWGAIRIALETERKTGELRAIERTGGTAEK